MKHFLVSSPVLVDNLLYDFEGLVVQESCQGKYAVSGKIQPDLFPILVSSYTENIKLLRIIYLDEIVSSEEASNLVQKLNYTPPHYRDAFIFGQKPLELIRGKNQDPIIFPHNPVMIDGQESVLCFCYEQGQNHLTTVPIKEKQQKNIMFAFIENV